MVEPAPRFRVVPAAYVLLIDNQGRVLLSHRRGTGYMDEHWAFGVAGHVEDGESVFQAAVREASEELGVAVKQEDLIPLTVMHRTDANGHPIDERVDFFFAVRRWVGEPQIQEPDKAAGLRWADPNAFPSPVVPHEAFVLDLWAHATLPVITTFGFKRPDS